MLCTTCDSRPIAYKIAGQCRVCYRKEQARAAVGTTLRVSLCVGGCGLRVHNTPYLVLPGIPLGHGLDNGWCYACYKAVPRQPRAVVPEFKDMGHCKRCDRPIGSGTLPEGFVRHNSHGHCASCATAIIKDFKYVGKRGHENQKGASNYASILTENMVLEIRERAANGESGTVIARDYPVSRNTVYDVINRKTWAHLH